MDPLSHVGNRLEGDVDEYPLGLNHLEFVHVLIEKDRLFGATRKQICYFLEILLYIPHQISELRLLLRTLTSFL